MNREYHRWFSPHLGRDMELLVFGHAGARMLVFPTRDGRFFDYENWGLVHALRAPLEDGRIQLFCLDSVDRESLYCFGCHPQDRIARHLHYEAYVLDEVLLWTRQKNPDPFVIAHGCSLGAFHAVNIAFRHPHLFGKVVALSGRYDLTVAVRSFPALFDGHYDQTVYFNTPSHFIPRATDPHLLHLLRRLEIVLAVGEEDAFLDNNRQLSNVLWDKGIWHALHVWQGEAHKARDWRQMVSLYL